MAHNPGTALSTPVNSRYPLGLPERMAPVPTNGPEDCLYQLGILLTRQNYEFVTVTPASHARIVARRGGELATARDLRDVFGWNLPFADDLLPTPMLEALRTADMLDTLPTGLLRSRVRVATLAGRLFLHSAWPTTQPDAVFFGPDTYRFAQFVRSRLPQRWLRRPRIVEVGCGSGAVGLLAGQWLQLQQPKLHLLDINERALAFTRINARLGGQSDEVEIAHSDLLQSLAETPDLILCNPPYLPDAAGRRYRDGGAQLGSALSLRLVGEALERLPPGGLLLLYTGTAVVGGQAVFEQTLRPLLREAAQGRSLHYEYQELDPDVFGEELDEPGLATAERIAVVGLAVHLHRN